MDCTRPVLNEARPKGTFQLPSSSHGQNVALGFNGLSFGSRIPVVHCCAIRAQGNVGLPTSCPRSCRLRGVGPLQTPYHNRTAIPE